MSAFAICGVADTVICESEDSSFDAIVEDVVCPVWIVVWVSLKSEASSVQSDSSLESSYIANLSLGVGTDKSIEASVAVDDKGHPVPVWQGGTTVDCAAIEPIEEDAKVSGDNAAMTSNVAKETI